MERVAGDTIRIGAVAETPDPLAGIRKRTALCGLAVALVLVAGLARLFTIQVLEHDLYRGRWEQQVLVTVLTPAERGPIRFRGGEIAACSRQRAPSICADPSKLRDPAGAAALLADALGMTAPEVLARLTRPGRFAWVARHVDLAQAAAVAALRLPGIELRGEAERRYPHAGLAAHVLGFPDIDGIGREGVERTYQALLNGSAGERVFVRDAMQHTIALADAPGRDPVRGAELTLTVDVQAQQVAEAEVADAVARWGAASGLALVLDVATGGIRALAVVPTYDPTKPGDATADARRNRALTDPIEPGSLMKVFSVGTALAQGAVTPETRIDCGGKAWTYRGRTLENYKPNGILTVADVLMKSSNVGAVRAVLAMGGREGPAGEWAAWHKLETGLRAFGFGTRTGVDLPGEARGALAHLAAWGKWDYWTLTSVPTGYQVLVTPMQLAAALNAVANDGVWVAPHVVSRADGPDGAPLALRARPAPRRIWTVEQARQMRALLTRVVTDGTAKSARVEGLELAGKTSTAKKLRPDGKYDETESLCAFGAMAPAAAPVLTVVVVLDRPSLGARTDRTGGRVAGPVAGRILARLLGGTPPPALGPTGAAPAAAAGVAVAGAGPRTGAGPSAPGTEPSVVVLSPRLASLIAGGQE